MNSYPHLAYNLPGLFRWVEGGGRGYLGEHSGKGRLGWDTVVFSKKILSVGKAVPEGESLTTELCFGWPCAICPSSLRPLQSLIPCECPLQKTGPRRGKSPTSLLPH